MNEDSADAWAETESGPQGVVPAGAPARRPGEIIAGKYALVRYLAKGGMAEVWLATHESLRTEVAVKFVDPQLARDSIDAPIALERFRFEAQISARLSARTRHVVAVHDAGMHEGAPYLVMEYVPGRTLEAELEAGGPMSPARFAVLLDQVADALGAAHALGIVHRDVKPSNLLLVDEPDGGLTVKVADFGVAKALRAAPGMDRPRETTAGLIVGSPAFMSPEQLGGGGQVDERADLWSLGVVAYEALTGQNCFEGPSMMELFAAITTVRYRRASSVRPELPRGVDAWLARAISRRPEDRFGSAAEMNLAFRAALSISPRRRVRLAAAALLAATALLGVLVAGRWAAAPRASEALPSARIAAAPPPPASTRPPVIEPAINVSDLPTVEPARPAAAARSGPARRPAPPETPATAAPPPPTAPPATPPPGDGPRKSKGVDPSEIQ